MSKFAEILGLILIAIVTVAAIVLIAGFPVMLLWNWLVPELFGFVEITFWQAVGLMALCSMLFNFSTSGGSKK
jgi:hypothetical protein